MKRFAMRQWLIFCTLVALTGAAVSAQQAATPPAEKQPAAHADNSGLVSIAIPADFTTRTTEFVAELERITVQTDRAAKVVVNERTGQ